MRNKGKSLRCYLLRSMTGEILLMLHAPLISSTPTSSFFMSSSFIIARKTLYQPPEGQPFAFPFRFPKLSENNEGRKIGNFNLLCIRKLHKNKRREDEDFTFFCSSRLQTFRRGKNRLSDKNKKKNSNSPPSNSGVCHDKKTR